MGDPGPHRLQHGAALLSTETPPRVTHSTQGGLQRVFGVLTRHSQALGWNLWVGPWNPAQGSQEHQGSSLGRKCASGLSPTTATLCATATLLPWLEEHLGQGVRYLERLGRGKIWGLLG